MPSFCNASKSYSVRGLSGVSKYVWSINDFSIFFARKYASFGHSAYCRNHYGSLSHLREKYGKSSQDFVDFHFAATHIFTECFFVVVHISQHNHSLKIQDDSFPLVCTLYWYIVIVAYWWRFLFGVIIQILDAK